MKRYSTKTITTLSLMVALEVVLSRFCSISTWNLRIGLSFIPVAMTAMLYGPLAAGIVGVLSDIIGTILFSTGVYFPGFTLTAFLNGIIFGLFLYPRQSLPRIIAASAIKQIFCTLLLNSLWLSLLYNSPFSVILVSRLPQAGISFIAEVLILSAMVRLLPRIQTLVFGSEQEQRQHQRTAGLLEVNAMTEAERLRAQEKITQVIAFSEEWRNANTILSYQALPGEVTLTRLFHLAKEQGKHMTLPFLFENGEMAAVYTEEPDSPTEGQLSVFNHDAIADPSSVDLILTPCAAFDSYVNYLGRGDKAYERLLGQCGNATVAVCAYYAQKQNYVTPPAGMIPPDKIITERETFLPTRDGKSHDRVRIRFRK